MASLSGRPESMDDKTQRTPLTGRFTVRSSLAMKGSNLDMVGSSVTLHQSRVGMGTDSHQFHSRPNTGRCFGTEGGV